MNDPATVGRQIKQKYPQYSNIDDATLGQKYIQKYGGAAVGSTTTTTQQPQTPAPTIGQGGVQNVGQGIGSLLNTFGLQAIPNILGGTYEAGRYLASKAGVKDLYIDPATGKMKQNPFLTEQDLSRVASKPVETIARQTAGLASYGLPSGAGVVGQAITGAGRGALLTAGVPEMTPGQIAAGGVAGAILEPAVQFLRSSGTFKVLGQRTQAAVQDATDRGVKIDWNNVLDDANKSTIAKTSAGKQAITKVWEQFSPASLSGSTDPASAYAARNTIRDTYGSSLFEKIFQEPKSKLETKAAEVVRESISKQLHAAVPETKSIDTIITWYNKGGLLKGDIPQKVKKAAIAILGIKGGKSLLQTLFYTGGSF